MNDNTVKLNSNMFHVEHYLSIALTYIRTKLLTWIGISINVSRGTLLLSIIVKLFVKLFQQ